MRREPPVSPRGRSRRRGVCSTAAAAHDGLGYPRDPELLDAASSPALHEGERRTRPARPLAKRRRRDREPLGDVHAFPTWRSPHSTRIAIVAHFPSRSEPDRGRRHARRETLLPVGLRSARVLREGPRDRAGRLRAIPRARRDDGSRQLHGKRRTPSRRRSRRPPRGRGLRKRERVRPRRPARAVLDVGRVPPALPEVLRISSTASVYGSIENENRARSGQAGRGDGARADEPRSPPPSVPPPPRT